MFEDRTPLRPAELLQQAIGGFQAPKQGRRQLAVAAFRLVLVLRQTG